MGYVAAALAPVFIIAFYIYVRDRYDREPLFLLALSLAAGSLIVLPVLWAGRLLVSVGPEAPRFAGIAYRAFVVAAANEEFFKYAAVMLLVWRSPRFDEQFDGIVYAVFVSLGFAAVENVLYVTGGGYPVALVRAFTAVPAHALFGITMGFYIGVARRYEEVRQPYLRRALWIPWLLHGIYDVLLMAEVAWLLLLFVPYLVWLYLAGARKIRVLSDASVFRRSEPD